MLFFFYLLFWVAASAAPPNLILWVLDDIGWADVGYHGSNFPTPTIDNLARSGVELNRMYVMPQCSPTRSALMTGRFAFHTGMSHFSTILPGSPAGIPASVPTFAEQMKAAGYQTHAIGKWHLGMGSWPQTPQGRGFDSYLGYMQGQTDYYNHTIPACGTPCLNPLDKGRASPYGPDAAGYDFWSGPQPLPDLFGQYTMDAYMARATDIISNYTNGTDSKPLFLYFAEQLLHIPIQAPPEEEHMEACKHVVGGSAAVNRTVLCSMASKLDSSMSQLVSLLKAKGMWDNTLIWVVSDNGGMTHWAEAFPASASSNFPLRGGKTTLFEGGVRSVSFLSGGFLPKHVLGQKREELLHAVDVLPTFTYLAGVDSSNSSLDGFNFWPTLVNSSSSSSSSSSAVSLRTDLPLNIAVNPLNPFGAVPHLPHPTDGVANYSSVISWPWKLILGDRWVDIGRVGGDRDGYWTIDDYSHLDKPADDGGDSVQVRLYNIQSDETEQHNVADANPSIVSALTAKITKYASKAGGFVPDQINIPSPKANPFFHNWLWAPFKSDQS
mmetsp:Transcript_13173/g.25572  ORF Transcript_13173/g.25572 Transcript_13173/m.25572 type:complete len:552 (+) Transcript_13173:81-1736(+)